MAGPRERPPLLVRRIGYTIGGAVNLVLLYVVNAADWQDLSFLTGETDRLLWLLNVSLVANVAANALYVVHDPPAVKAAGDIATTLLGLALLSRIWQVFPFDVGGEWELVLRTFLALGIAGCAIAVLTGGIALARALHPDEPRVSSLR